MFELRKQPRIRESFGKSWFVKAVLLFLLIIHIPTPLESSLLLSRWARDSNFFLGVETESIQNSPYFYLRHIDRSYLFPAKIEFRHQTALLLTGELSWESKFKVHSSIPFLYKRNTKNSRFSIGDLSAGLTALFLKKSRIFPTVNMTFPTGPLTALSNISISGGEGRLQTRFSILFEPWAANRGWCSITPSYTSITKDPFERRFDTLDQYDPGGRLDCMVSAGVIPTRFLWVSASLSPAYLFPIRFEGKDDPKTDVFFWQLKTEGLLFMRSGISLSVVLFADYYPSLHHCAPGAGCGILLRW